MAKEDYIKAKKLGDQACREAIGAGSSPYVGVLEDVLKGAGVLSETDLGVTEIPLERIAGTYDGGRKTAFAPNFMPILAENSEFAVKWSLLYDSLVEKGLRESIRAYEYMNRYYVVEGNKRVSVMKFLGALSIPGAVTRVIPKRDGTPENRAYFEYLDFCRVCPENYMVFTEPGAYGKFLELAGKAADEVWTADERADLKSLYYRFRKAFDADRAFLPKYDPSDAFLAYLEVYGYADSLEKTPDKIRTEILSLREELELLAAGENVQLKLEADEAPKKGILSLLSPQGTGSRVLRIDFVYDSAPEASSWTYLHELGRAHIESRFGEQIQTRAFYSVDPEKEAGPLLSKLSEEGADVVFAASRTFLSAALSAAVQHPETRYLCCTLNAAHRYIRTYYARLYEVKFLSGLIAGILSDGEKIGYLADFPSAAHLANVNAFALGVRTVRPDAKVHVQWRHQEGADPQGYFREQGIRIVSGREMVNLSAPERDFGLYRLADGQRVNLAMPLWNWGVVYEKIVESIQNGAFDQAAKAGSPRAALNYWWGISSGAIDIFYSKDLPQETVRLAEHLKDDIRDGRFPVFPAKIAAQDGRTVLAEDGKALSPEEILKIDWLAENVVGRIPLDEELTTYGRAVMRTEKRQVRP